VWNFEEVKMPKDLGPQAPRRRKRRSSGNEKEGEGAVGIGLA
jgi:hypothetical protein